jgi:nicotinate-nucleotide adenylyltransferase
MAHLATEDFPKLKPSDIEFKLSQPNYTVNTLVHLEKYPNHEFSLIMGKRQLNILIQVEKFWSYFAKSCDLCLSTHRSQRSNRRSTFIRVGSDLKITQSTFNWRSIVEISSTFIRKSIKEGKNIQPLLPTKVWEYIDHNNFTRNNPPVQFSSASISEKRW